MSATSTIPITIGGEIIQFPNSGASSLWSPAIIQFAEAVATQLLIIANPFNIASTVQPLSSNANSNIFLAGNGSNLSFPHTAVRSFNLTYAVYRVTYTPSFPSSPTTNIQSGTVNGIYNDATGFWSLEHDFQGDVVGGIPYCTFGIDGSDQILFSSTILSGTSYDVTNSKISYSATIEPVNT